MTVMKEGGRTPVIIIGMHRSGTGLLALLLEKLGLFVGEKKDNNNEAKFFFHINRWLMNLCGGTWDYPRPCDKLLSNSKLKISAVRHIQFLMTSPYVISFLGWRKYILHRTPQNLNLPWGWKDPRNTYTLPIWLEIFPGAKIIHMYRHGVDVAKSLKIRHERILKWRNSSNTLQRLYYGVERHWLGLSLRCADLHGGFSLWEEYLKQAKMHVNQLDGRAIEVKYENLVAKPREQLRTLCEFCQLPVTDYYINEAIRLIQKSRAYAYLTNPNLERFAERVADRFRSFGY